MKIAILLTGHVRDSLKHDHLHKIIAEINKIGQCDIYGCTSNKKDHSTKTWYKIDEQSQNELVDIEKLNKFLNFKNLVVYEEPVYDKNLVDILWAKAPLSYVAARQLYSSIRSCLIMLEGEYDYIFRLRFDYYKFNSPTKSNWGDYTNRIISFISSVSLNKNAITAIKVPNARGEDSFFFSDKESFIKVIEYILHNFDEIEKYAKNLDWFFRPEDLLAHSCAKQNINFASY